jgi:hypothetical protein
MTKRPPTYQEGDVFSVWRREGERCPLVVCRRSSKGREGYKLLYVWAFEPGATETLLSIAALEPSILYPRVLLLGCTGDIAIMSGRWTRLGRVAGFTRRAWPMPPETRIPGGSNEAYLDWRDQDTFERLGATPIAMDDVPHYPEGGVMDPGALEGMLHYYLAHMWARPRYDFSRFQSLV